MASRVEKVVGEALVLDCEVSRLNAEVTWKKNGEEVGDSRKITILEDGVLRQLTVHSLGLEDAGQYVCDAKDDVMDFLVTVHGRSPHSLKDLKRYLTPIPQFHALVEEDDRPGRGDINLQNNTSSLTIKQVGVRISYPTRKLCCFCVFSDLPVRILGKNDAKSEKQFLISDDIILVCELSRSNAPVRWYKDNRLIDDTEHYCSEEQGVFRSLVVLNAGLEDSGEYTCDAVDDKMIFHILVKGNIVAKQSQQMDRTIGWTANNPSPCSVQSPRYRSLETPATRNITRWCLEMILSWSVRCLGQMPPFSGYATARS